MVAKAMANQDRANAEQQAMINRLADEFATELNNLGVRVAALEKKVGNVKVTGDVRLRVRGNDKVKFEAGYGYLLQGEYFGKVADEQDEKAEFAYASVKTNVGDKATIGGFYGKFSGEGVGIGNNKYEDVYGFNVNANFNKVWIGGEWLDMNDVDDASAWVAGIGYGDYKISKAGSWDVKARYIDQDTNAFLPKTTFVQPTRNYSYTSNSKGWIASVDYALQKNVGLSAYYGFSWETQKGADLGDFYRAELNYKF